MQQNKQLLPADLAVSTGLAPLCSSAAMLQASSAPVLCWGSSGALGTWLVSGKGQGRQSCCVRAHRLNLVFLVYCVAWPQNSRSFMAVQASQCLLCDPAALGAHRLHNFKISPLKERHSVKFRRSTLGCGLSELFFQGAQPRANGFSTWFSTALSVTQDLPVFFLFSFLLRW